MNNKLNLLNLFPNEEKLEIILEQVNDLKKSLDSFRPLEGVHIDKLNDYFDEVYTYDSTTIEGNTLTLQETALVLNKGVTIGGKSLREHFEIINKDIIPTGIDQIFQLDTICPYRLPTNSINNFLSSWC